MARSSRFGGAIGSDDYTVFSLILIVVGLSILGWAGWRVWHAEISRIALSVAHYEMQAIGLVTDRFAAADLAYIANHYIYLDHDQTWTGSAGAAYHWTSGALTGSRVSADLVYGSGLRKDGAVPNGDALPAYATVNLSIGHKFEHSGFDVRLDVENLFDKIYEIRDGGGVGAQDPGP